MNNDVLNSALEKLAKRFPLFTLPKNYEQILFRQSSFINSFVIKKKVTHALSPYSPRTIELIAEIFTNFTFQ